MFPGMANAGNLPLHDVPRRTEKVHEKEIFSIPYYSNSDTQAETETDMSGITEIRQEPRSSTHTDPLRKKWLDNV